MPLRGVREVKTHAAARRRCAASLRGVCGVKTHAAARRVRGEDAHRCAACGQSRIRHTPLRGV